MRKDQVIITSDVTGKEYVFPKPEGTLGYPQLWKISFKASTIDCNGNDRDYLDNSERPIYVEREILDIVGVITPRPKSMIPEKTSMTVEQEIAETLNKLLNLMGVVRYEDVR